MRNTSFVAALIFVSFAATHCAAVSEKPHLRLRGGLLSKKQQKAVEDASPSPLPTEAFATGGGRKTLYAVCLAAIFGWLTLSSLAYSTSEGWPITQAIFYSVDVGMGIGFGAFIENFTRTKVFSCVHMLMCASGVAGALALFTEAVIADAANLAAAEFADAAIKTAFKHADSTADGKLGTDELSLALRSLGLMLSPGELNAVFAAFDHDGDGVISSSEFARAVKPHLRGTSVADAVRAAIAYSSRSRLAHVVSATRNFCFVQHRTLLVWVLWVALGVVWGMLHQGWDGVTALYSSLSALTTSGLQAPATNAAGHVPADASLFLAGYCLFGIPIMGLAVGKFAGIFVESLLVRKEQLAMMRPISEGEFELAESLFKADSQVDFGEFVALELMRLGRVDVGTLELLKAEFTRLDTDRSGKLSKKEAMQVRRVTSSVRAV